jgi:benzoyl-CoA-dihydrodiol lyase
MAAETETADVSFETHPDRYRHWKLSFPSEYGGKVARLLMDVQEDGGLRPGYPLKLNSYDLGVDIELADALSRIRFEHPAVKAVVFASDKDRIFCSGANIYMLGSSTHGFKVNFCKFTNETRLQLEEMSEKSGIQSLAALSGTASGGGYELAIACDEILLVDDGSSAVSFPEAPLLGVLPGTGGLTRLTDKRKIRRDLADVFSTVAEGVRGKRAVAWNLVDEAPPRAQFAVAVGRRLEAMVARSKRVDHAPMTLVPLEYTKGADRIDYSSVTLAWNDRARTAVLTVKGPGPGEPQSAGELAKVGAKAWIVRAMRELDHALLHLRFNLPQVSVVSVRTEGNADAVRAVDRMLIDGRNDGLVREVTALVARVLKRFDLTAKSFFALVEPGSAFVGTLFELALAADRTFMKDDPDAAVAIELSPMNGGAYLMANGQSRLVARFGGDAARAGRLIEAKGPFDPGAAEKEGLVTFTPDEIDWEDEIRIAIEERASLSPDAMTGMEASLRFGGPETMETKIFGRLSAWQNWIFQRPNAVGQKGALTLYGKPERPEFEYRRT